MDEQSARRTGWPERGRMALEAVTARTRLLTAEWSSLPSVPRWIWVGLNAAALLACVRSLTKSADASSDPWGVCLVLAVVGTAGVICRGLCPAGADSQEDWRTTIWSLILGGMPLVLLSLAALPRLPAAAGGAALAIGLYSLAAIACWNASAAACVTESCFEPQASRHVAPPPSQGDGRSGVVAGMDEPADSEELPFPAGNDTVTHWLRRSLPAPGQDHLEGAFRIDFAAGQKLACAHVPFTPPFAGLPEITCEVLADSDVRAKVAAVYPYGVRVELRRSGAIADAEFAELQFVASFAAARAGQLSQDARPAA